MATAMNSTDTPQRMNDMIWASATLWWTIAALVVVGAVLYFAMRAPAVDHGAASNTSGMTQDSSNNNRSTR